MTRIAFVADLHADDLGHKVNPSSGLNVRFTDALDVLRWIAGDAFMRNCHVLIVGGDFTENRHPAPWRVRMIADALAAFGRPTFLLRGNHDGLRAGLSIVDVLAPMLEGPNVAAFPFSRPGIAPLDAKGEAYLCAIPYLDRSWMRANGLGAAPDADVYRALEDQFLAIARGLYVEAKEAGAAKVLLVIHQALAGGQMTDAQAAFLGGVSLVVDTAALAAIGFDAILAGHFHAHQVLRTEPLVVYAGSPHRVTFQEENQEKGYLVLDTDHLPEFEFVSTPARRFVTLRYGDLARGPGDERPGTSVDGAVVRVLDVPAGEDAASIRGRLESLGALEVVEVRALPAEAASPRGLGEALEPIEALAAWLEHDPDRDALLELGRALLEEAAP